MIQKGIQDVGIFIKYRSLIIKFAAVLSVLAFILALIVGVVDGWVFTFFSILWIAIIVLLNVTSNSPSQSDGDDLYGFGEDGDGGDT